MDDAYLAELVAQGDRKAGGALIDRYQAKVRGFLLRLSRKADVADDLAQETFIKMLTNAERFDPQYTMTTWLLTIARRLWLNHQRRAVNHTASPDGTPIRSSAPDPADVALLADQARHARRVLDDAMASLPEPQRTALVLFHEHDMSITEMSQVMKMPDGTIKSHLHRGRAALRRILGPQLEVIGT